MTTKEYVRFVEWIDEAESSNNHSWDELRNFVNQMYNDPKTTTRD